jgi:acetylglutamate kinase
VVSAAGQPVVVKLGGRALEAPGATADFAAALAALVAQRRPAVVVHGGGAEVTQWCLKLGLEARFTDGLRVTDPATLEVVAGVLAGLANKRLVAALRARGVDAVGLAALDGGILHVRPHARAAVLGAVGEVAGADDALLATLLARGSTPVLASLAALDGELLNVNADDAASAVAVALRAADLVLLSDAPGLRLAGTVVRELRTSAIDEALARPEVEGGMRPKLRAAAAALAAGVSRAHIACWTGPATLASLLAGSGGGTTLVADTEDAHV